MTDKFWENRFEECLEELKKEVTHKHLFDAVTVCEVYGNTSLDTVFANEADTLSRVIVGKYEELQSKLDKAVEALDAVANSQIINKDALKSSCIQRSMARKALKEIKGE